METIIKKPSRKITLVLLVCSTLLMSCSEGLCPAYVNSMQNVKSIKGENTGVPGQKSAVPSPYNEEYKRHSIRKFLVSEDSALITVAGLTAQGKTKHNKI